MSDTTGLTLSQHDHTHQYIKILSKFIFNVSEFSAQLVLSNHPTTKFITLKIFKIKSVVPLAYIKLALPLPQNTIEQKIQMYPIFALFWAPQVIKYR